MGLALSTIIEGADTELHTPAICDIEVCSGFRRIARSGVTGTDRIGQALDDFLDLPVTRYGHRSLLPRIFDLRENFTASDGAYIALSEELDATFVTCDARLTRAVQGLLDLNVIGVSEPRV